MLLLWKAGPFTACFHRPFSVFLSGLGRINVTHTHRQEVVKRMMLESGAANPSPKRPVSVRGGDLIHLVPLFTSNTPVKGSKRYMCKGGHRVVMITAQLVIGANEGPGGKLLAMYLDPGAESTRKQGQIYLLRKRRSACVYTRSQAKMSTLLSPDDDH